MSDSRTWRSDGFHAELARGLACARRDHYADAAAHFAVARELVAPAGTPLLVALDAFIDSHTRYWQAQQALHEASRRFATISVDQQERFVDLQRHLSSLIGDEDLAQASLSEALATGDTHPLYQPDDKTRTHDQQRHRAHPTLDDNPLPALRVVLFGRFEVWRSGVPLALCHNRNGQAILRYLAAHPHYRATTDTLIEALWPEDDGDTARHKLHVAVSALRQSLNDAFDCPKGGGYLLCRDGVYLLNPAITVTTDVEEFLALYEAGRCARQESERARQDAMVRHYEEACRLYTGPFLQEDLYADWSLIQRERLALSHLTMCEALADHYAEAGHYDDAIGWAATILAENRCDEAAHRGLMRAYAASGRRGEAVRQYQRCERVLAEDIGVQPMPETTALFHAIVRGHESIVDSR